MSSISFLRIFPFLSINTDTVEALKILFDSHPRSEPWTQPISSLSNSENWDPGRVNLVFLNYLMTLLKFQSKCWWSFSTQGTGKEKNCLSMKKKNKAWYSEKNRHKRNQETNNVFVSVFPFLFYSWGPDILLP